MGLRPKYKCLFKRRKGKKRHGKEGNVKKEVDTEVIWLYPEECPRLPETRRED